MRTVAILEGWAGGPWHTKKLRTALIDAGYKIIKRKNTADIILAHSAGCFDIPKANNAKLIIMIGAPYWPGRHLLKRLLRKVNTDSRSTIKQFGWQHFCLKKFWEFIYILIQPRHTWLGISQHNKIDFLERQKDKRVVFIRNNLDDFCDPKIENHLRPYENVEYISMPGEHDDYYYNPEPYIEIIKNHL